MPTAVGISNELHLQLSKAKTIIVIRWHLDGQYITGFASFISTVVS